MRAALYGLALLALGLLSGCGGLQTRQSESSQAFAANRSLTDWQLSGRIGVRSDASAHSGYLNWTQCGTRFEIRINGPLGSGAVKLLGDANRVTLYEGDQPPLSASTPEQLLADTYGWDLPLSHLQFWIRGIPDPAIRATAAQQGFRQAGWQLSYPRQTSIDHLTLPAKAVASNGATRVTLVMQGWQLTPDCRHL